MSFGDERGAVQNKIIQYCTDIGWEYLSPDEALIKRNGENNIILKEIFTDQLLKLNPKINYEHAEEIIRKLECIPANIEGNLTAWEYLKGLKQVFISDENREIDIKLLDTKNISNNTFHITDELKFVSGNNTNRYDIVFYINGFPVLMVETKAAHKIDGLIEALEQVKRYHRETPEALALLQLFSITHLIEFYYSATWNFSSKDLNRWKHKDRYDFENLIKTFFDRKNITKIITDYILFTKKDDRLNKVVLKPHQLRAVDKVIKRAKDKKKKRGLIWHTQGSGKTYTMITAAKLILENPQFENPTVIMLVDRNELEQQLFNNLSSVGIENLRVALSKKDLQKLLIDDYRGLIVSTIHKFHLMPADINKRKNIFVFIDEAHRTTEGDLGTYLMSALPNATIIGFTGTPRDKTKHGKGTFITFGKDDPPYGYLDKYSILESIEDGTTLKINYALAENSLLPDKETLEKEFLNLKEIEGVSDIETLNRALQKSATLRNFLKNKDRINKIAQYIAKHFKENVEPMGYKAFIVAVDREACAIYKEALDKYLPPEYSEVIISKSHNDPPELKKYHYTEEEEKLIRKKFKEEENPKILIVTEKLLTGFDAPILYAMYLDKPMRDHVLLQAIARVNRPYEDENGRKKPAGLIIDFVGILDNLEKALAFDSSDIEGVLTDLEVLKGYLKDLMEEGRIKYLSILKGKTEDKAVEEVLNHFKDEEKRHNFYQFYEELKSIYE
ncbi:HsdR family type I site-specific deoxyribonuclease, partial [Hydrogenivirga sp. 128-5-R1-1]|uniref:type I restriction endonuclease subunit R n=1 Tax=Hydrogenivirga sp. 128-5-R1-1 TaxID=392423 RepID=UPI00015F0DD4